MSVYQLPDGRWLCEYRKGMDPDRPNTNKKYFGRGEAAEKEAREYNALLGFGNRNKQKSPTFIELVNEYTASRRYQMASSTLHNFSIKMDRIILPILGNEMAHALTPKRLDDYIGIRSRAGQKMTTIHRELSDIRAVLNWSYDRNLIANNPMRGFEMPKRDDARIQPPTEQEFKAILECAVPHLKRAMLISWHTGLRPGREELLSLTWQAIDFHSQTITVMSADKGGLPRRIIPLNKTILRYLDEWYSEDEKNGYHYLVHYNGKKIDEIKKSWQAAKRRARITRRLRMYDIRHAFATDLLASGANLKAVSEILGHASPDMTMKVYQHVNDDLKRAAVLFRE